MPFLPDLINCGFRTAERGRPGRKSFEHDLECWQDARVPTVKPVWIGDYELRHRSAQDLETGGPLPLIKGEDARGLDFNPKSEICNPQ